MIDDDDDDDDDAFRPITDFNTVSFSIGFTNVGALPLTFFSVTFCRLSMSFYGCSRKTSLCELQCAVLHLVIRPVEKLRIFHNMGHHKLLGPHWAEQSEHSEIQPCTESVYNASK